MFKHKVIQHFLKERPQLQSLLFKLAFPQKNNAYLLYSNLEQAKALSQIPIAEIIDQIENIYFDAQEELKRAKENRGKQSMWYLVAQYHLINIQTCLKDLLTLEQLIYEFNYERKIGTQK